MKLKRRKKEEVWSPYGHEPARRQLLAERRVQIIVAAVALVLAYYVILTITADDSGPQVGRSGASIPDSKQKPVTVGVSPGGLPAFARPGVEAPDPADAPRPVHRQNEWLAKVQPWLSLVAPLFTAFWLLSKAGASARGRLAELNLGVYKGAMPYEMHVARARARVFTHRQVEANVFGKTREDFVFGTYLTEPPLVVRQMLGMTQSDRAEVTRLKRGGARRAA